MCGETEFRNSEEFEVILENAMSGKKNRYVIAKP
jgi:hypothetical protein